MKVVLISPYEIGRQPFALAQPAAWLKQDDFDVDCLDLSCEPLDESRLIGVQLIAIHLIMHAGARLASEFIPRIKSLAPHCKLCVFGLYAPVNDDYFRSLGCEYVFGGEIESNLLSLCRAVRDGSDASHLQKTNVCLDKLPFIKPDRSKLPSLDNYSRLMLPNGSEKIVGFVEGSRGCKHLCRHCPVVPVYSGAFRVINADIVMDDVRQQIQAGAEHISFGDPDFLNGPGHARRLVARLHEEFPGTTWDATIKIEHLLKNERLLECFAQSGCLFITSAVESIEDKVLEKLQKGHTANDFKHALRMLRQLGITMLPTFVPFTPWTTVVGYCRLLNNIVELGLVESVAPVQLSIRLLVPRGSRLLELDDTSNWLGGYNPELLGYAWDHPDCEVDRLQREISNWVSNSEITGLNRAETFAGVWSRAFSFAGVDEPKLELAHQLKVPQMSEQWYCCAEPIDAQRSYFSVNSTADAICTGVILDTTVVD